MREMLTGTVWGEKICFILLPSNSDLEPESPMSLGLYYNQAKPLCGGQVREFFCFELHCDYGRLSKTVVFEHKLQFCSSPHSACPQYKQFKQPNEP